MTNVRILCTVVELQQHVCTKLRQLSPEVSEEQIIHRYLAALDLTPTEHHAILDEYRRRALGIRDKLL